MTWIVEFRPGNKTIYVVFDEESECSGPRTPKLRPDQVFEENVPHKHVLINVLFLIISFFVNILLQGVKHITPRVKFLGLEVSVQVKL